MALLDRAAKILSFDVVSEAIIEHDDWLSHEHLRERLAITGFRRPGSGRNSVAIKSAIYQLDYSLSDRKLEL